uniref:Uncharacterized protein n=1 Tax=Musa acuminata subsp. malaccensis TaxID=214687 RepID=A0A804HT05_MUSAM
MYITRTSRTGRTRHGVMRILLTKGL